MEGASWGGSKFLKLSLMVKHNCGLVLMTLVFQGGNLETVQETLSIQCPSLLTQT